MKRVERRKGTWSVPALRVLEERYLAKRNGRPVETPDEMCWRVAAAVAEAERLHPGGSITAEEAAEAFYELMVTRKFLPNSPTLMNAGKGNGQQLSACFVLPVEDSMEGIFDALKYAAIIHKSGGGTGFAFSRLRPEGAEVSTTQGVASGPVSFMKVFDAATESVKQGGARRGANMGILRVDHPDILKFIECKLDGGITNFNISVAATDAFMRALADDGEYDLVAPHTGQVVGRLRAREVFDRICRAAWATGDPGMIFIDRINRSPANPTPELGMIEATNPCGEQPLLPFEACNLGSINLSLMVTDDWAGIDWGELERVVRLSVRFLDDVIDVNPYPLPQIHEMVKGNRRIGLGVMGWADLLFKLGIPYDSEAALELAEELMGFINKVGHEESAKLAQERGPFPNWPRSIYRNGPPLRNSTVTTIAPTGTISIIADCSSGIEPVFALAFTHRANGRELEFINPVFKETAERRGFASASLFEAVSRQGTLKGLDLPEDVRRVFVTAMEIDPEWHVRMQAAFQRHTDNAVSKTINMPNSATVDDVKRAYLLAYELGCLGITVFRDGCKGTQVLNVGTGRDAEQRTAAPVAVKPRPEVVSGYTRQVKAPEGTVNITLNSDKDGLLEVFINVGKAGSDIAALAEALGRLISLTLRMPSPMSQNDRAKEIAGQLKNIGGSRFVGFGPNRVRSLPDAVAQALEKHLGIGQENGNNGNGTVVSKITGNLCPECGNNSLVFEEGCRKCPVCGYSEC